MNKGYMYTHTKSASFYLGHIVDGSVGNFSGNLIGMVCCNAPGIRLYFINLSIGTRIILGRT